MKIEGETTAPKAPPEMCRRLQEPEFIEQCVPGCTSLERTGPGEFIASFNVKMGPFGGVFKTNLTLSDLHAPDGYTMSVGGKSSFGVVGGSTRVTLEEDGAGTRISWDGDIEVTGMLAAIGQSYIGTTANRMANEFFGKAAELA